MNISQVYPGRPEKGSRISVEERSYDLLCSLDIPFTRVDHDSAATMDDLPPVEAALGCPIPKNLLLTNRQETEFYLLLMPGGKPFKTKYLSKQLGCARLSFAGEESLMELLAVTPGCASVLALAADSQRRVRLLMDRDIRGEEFFGCHPCINTSTLRLSFSDVMEVLLPRLGYESTWVELPCEGEEL